MENCRISPSSELNFGSSVVLNENKASADETNTESTLSTVTTGETTADLIEESTQTDNTSETTETSTESATSTSTAASTSDTDSSTTSTTSTTEDRLLHQQAVKHLIIQVLPQLQKQVLLKLLKATTSETSASETNNADETLALIQAQAPLKPLHLKQLQC